MKARATVDIDVPKLERAWAPQYPPKNATAHKTPAERPRTTLPYQDSVRPEGRESWPGQPSSTLSDPDPASDLRASPGGLSGNCASLSSTGRSFR